MSESIIDKCKAGMEKRLKAFEKDLTKVRTGRASVTLLDGVRVDYYGTPTPLNQVASLSTPDARSIVISPFEKSLISEIERSIQKADLGVHPTNDGSVVRIPIPQLTEDRRKDIAKSLKKLAEEAKVSVRHARRDANDTIKKSEKSKELAEDEAKKLQAEVQKVTDDFIKKIDAVTAVKEKEIMTV